MSSKPTNHDPVLFEAVAETVEGAWSVLRKVRLPRGWFLIIMGAGAAVAIWGGWVTLGGMCGFGDVQLLPGIIDALRVNLAITLPFSMEAYGGYSLASAISTRDLSRGTRWFASLSAVGALLLGMGGQAAYHLLQEYGYTRAPWPVTVVVSAIPVIALGLGATLYHLTQRDAKRARQAEEARQPVDIREFLARMRPAPAPHTYLTQPAAEHEQLTGRASAGKTLAADGGDGKAAAPRRPAPRPAAAKAAAPRAPAKPRLTAVKDKPETVQQKAGRLQRERAVALLLKNPGATGGDLAAALGVTPKHGRRLKSDPRVLAALAEARVAAFTGAKEEVHAG